MSLMLKTLKQIEAKQSPEPVLAALDEVMDQLQTYVAEAGLVYDSPPVFDEEEVSEAAADCPLPALLTEIPPIEMRQELPPPIVLARLPAVEEEPTVVQPVELPVETPAETDSAAPAVAPSPRETPYAEAAGRIVSQLPTALGQVLMFTSPGDGQGKTSTLARLAPWLAEKINGDVLVVDANFRNPDMARWLDVAPATRLAEVLCGEAVWREAVKPTAHARVSLLPGGTEGYGRAAIGASIALPRLLRDLAEQYSLVLVDAASLAQRDAAELAATCDATYLVVRLGDGNPRMLREAVRAIAGRGGRLMGCVAVEA